MSIIDEKLKRFETIVFTDVDAKINAAIAEADNYRDSALSEHKDKLMNEYFDYMQQQVRQIKSDIKRQISKAELNTQRELLLYRNEISNRVFAAVKKQLEEFAATEAYCSYLVEHIKVSIQRSGFTNFDLLVRESDKVLLNGIDCGGSVVSDNSIKLGGFILLNQADGLMIDESFDSKLDELVSYFNQTSGLVVGQ